MKQRSQLKLSIAALCVPMVSACAFEAPAPPRAVDRAVAPLKNATEGCSAEQVSAIEQALSQAYPYALNTMNDLGQVQNGGDATLFDYWFGSHGDEEVRTVSAKFKTIVDVFDTATFVCGCTTNEPFVFGETKIGSENPGRRIELCDDYFEGDFEEVRIGALFHEASHVAGTRHYVNPYCVPGDHYAWPESVHQDAQAPGGSGFAVESAEPYRLYALRWQPGRRSTIRDTCK